MSSTREARASFAVFVLRAGSGGSDRMRTLRLLGSNKYKKKKEYGLYLQTRITAGPEDAHTQILEAVLKGKSELEVYSVQPGEGK